MKLCRVIWFSPISKLQLLRGNKPTMKSKLFIKQGCKYGYLLHTNIVIISRMYNVSVKKYALRERYCMLLLKRYEIMITFFCNVK